MKDLITVLPRMLRRTFSKINDSSPRIFGIVIAICAYIAIGLAIKGKIDMWQMEHNALFNKALRIESDDAYKYAADTSVGYAYGYGCMEALQPVAVPEIAGEYLSLQRVKEHYTKHIRKYTTTDSKGNKEEHIEEYWTWDPVEKRNWNSDEVSFKSIKIEFGNISGISQTYIDTVDIDSYNRYVFRGAEKSLEGTLFGNMTGGTVKEAIFHENRDIESAADSDTSVDFGALFAILWVLLPAGVALAAFIEGR